MKLTKDVCLMNKKEKIIYIQNVCGKSKSFDLPYYVFKNIEKNGFLQTVFPMRLGFKITNMCQFRCTYCFAHKDDRNISLDTIKKVINDLDQKPYEVYLTGGDPLLHPDINEIIQLFHKCGIQLKIQTTGITSEENIFLLNNNLDKISSIQISIDSISQFKDIRKCNITNPLAEIKHFISSISSTEKIIVNTVVSKYNYSDLIEILDFCYSLGLHKIRFSPIFTTNSHLFLLDDELVDIFYETVKYLNDKNMQLIDTPFSHPWSLRLLENISSNRLFCPACKTEIEIDVDGNVYPCPFLHDKTHKLGNIYHDNINTIWLKGQSLPLSKTKWTNNKLCNKCKNYENCGGGCYANAYVNHTDYDVRCIIHDKN